MQVHPNQPDRPERRLPQDLSQQKRESVARAADQVQNARQSASASAEQTIDRVKNARQRIATGADRIEISAGAARAEGIDRESAAERAERVERLRELSQSGELNTPERVERAAIRLLGGE